MSYTVGFHTVSTAGMDSSPVAPALAGLRAHEARYFKNKSDHIYTVEPASDAKATIDWVHRILKERTRHRHLIPRSRGFGFQFENIRWTRLLRKRSVDQRRICHRRPHQLGGRVHLSEGMDVRAELASKFKFARQKSKLTGTIRGSYFNFKDDCPPALPER